MSPSFGQLADVGRRIGIFMAIMGLSALAGPPISGAINRRTGGFAEVGEFAGSVVMGSVGLLILVRGLMPTVRRPWGLGKV